jgi:hypothetical protein
MAQFLSSYLLGRRASPRFLRLAQTLAAKIGGIPKFIGSGGGRQEPEKTRQSRGLWSWCGEIEGGTYP